MKTNERFYYVDCIKGIGIILVVMGHHILEMPILRNWIYSFHMPLFFFVTGYLWKNRSQTVSEQIRKKAVSLLYPYYTFGFFILLWHILYKVVFHVPLSEVGLVSVFLRIVSTWGNLADWFLPAMFWATVIVIIADHYSLRDDFLAISMFLLGYMFAVISLNYKMDETIVAWIIVYVGRILIGCSFIFWGKTYRRIESKLADNRRKVIGVPIIAAILSIGGSYFFVDSQTNLAFLKLGNIFVYLLLAIVGIVFLFTSIRLIYKKRRIHILEYFGRNSLIVMLTHMEITGNIVWMIPRISTIGGNSIQLTSSVVVFIELLLSIVIIEAINRYLPFMLRPPVNFAKKKMAE